MAHDIVFDTKAQRFVAAGAWKNESSIDATVLTYPEIISRLLTGGDEYVISLAGAAYGGPQLLKIDALFLLDEGDAPARLVVWESKRSGNVHPRSIIGQVLDYASALAAMPSGQFASELELRMHSLTWRERFEASFQRRRQAVPDLAQIRARACEAHSAGRFVLMIGAESIPDDVVRISRWLTKRFGAENEPVQPVELAPIGDAGWIRAAALIETLEGVACDPLDEAFDRAVQRLQRVRAIDLVPVEATVLEPSIVALSALVPRSSARSVTPSSTTSVAAWYQGATPALRALHSLLIGKCVPPTWQWNVGTTALLLYLKVGDELIEALRLFGNRVYFVSEKKLAALGADAEIRWWRSEMTSFPVTDANAKQPVVAGQSVESLVADGDRLVAFLRQLESRVGNVLAGQ